MIHIVWKGWGFLVFVVTFGCSLIANLVTDWVTGSDAYWEAHKWPLAVALLVSGSACWALAGVAPRGERALVDPATGERVVLRSSHSFFWVPLTWWGPILGAIGVTVLCVELTKGG